MGKESEKGKPVKVLKGGKSDSEVDGSTVFGPSAKRRKGRPTGSKDARPRKRRKKNEMKDNTNKEAMLSLFAQQEVEDLLYAQAAGVCRLIP